MTGKVREDHRSEFVIRRHPPPAHGPTISKQRARGICGRVYPNGGSVQENHDRPLMTIGITPPKLPRVVGTAALDGAACHGAPVSVTDGDIVNNGTAEVPMSHTIPHVEADQTVFRHDTAEFIAAGIQCAHG